MLNNLYENIGGKIKGLAKWTFIVEAIGAIITGIVMINADSTLVLYGVLTIFFGPIVAWVSSWILYAFGELVDKTCALAEKNGITDKCIDVGKASNSSVFKKSGYSNGGKTTLVEEDGEYDDVECPNCGKTISILVDETEIVCPWCNAKYSVNW